MRGARRAGVLGADTTGVDGRPKRTRRELPTSPISPLQIPASGKVPLGARSSIGNNGGGPSRKNKPQRCSICKEWGHKSRTCRLAPGKGALCLPCAFIPAIPLSLRARSALPTQTPPPPCPLAPASLSHPHLVSQQRQSPTLTARPSSWTSSAKAFAWVHRVWRGPRSHLLLEFIMAT